MGMAVAVDAAGGQRGPGGGAGHCMATGSRRRAGQGGSAQTADRGKRVLLRASALYPLQGEHSRSGLVLGRPHCTLVPPAYATHIPVPHLCCLLSLPHAAAHSQGQGPPTPCGATQDSHTQTHKAARAGGSGTGGRRATLRTYRSADKICGNRRDGVRQDSSSAACSCPACLPLQGAVKPMRPSPSCRLPEGLRPPGYPPPRQHSAHLCSLS